MNNKLSRYLVFYNPQVLRSNQIAVEINDWINQHSGLHSECLLISELDEDLNQSADLLIAVGGDGTMLRVGRVASLIDCPVLGINLGQVGFLPQVRNDEWQESMIKVMSRDYELEPRMLIQGELYRNGDLLTKQDALNEIVVTRGKMARPVHLETRVDDSVLAQYVADGVIVATPTGSTAYSLAAGGPILPPVLRNIVVTPISPHLSMGTSVVLAEGCTVKIKVSTSHSAILSIDGHFQISVEDGDNVVVCASKNNCNFVRFQDEDYFYRDLNDRMSIKKRGIG